jgi:4-amino-4-deoxy-L-arabinose transferase-like glycosyltransferase
MTTRGFESYVQHVLAPTLQPGQIVGLDNLRQHQSARVRAVIKARGANIWFLPTYSPDLDPIKRAPLYPFFLAGVIRVLGPSLETTAIVQHALGLVTVVLVYLLGAVAFGRPTGLVAALGAATCRALLLTEHTVASEAVFTPLLVGSLLLVLLGIRT